MHDGDVCSEADGVGKLVMLRCEIRRRYPSFLSKMFAGRTGDMFFPSRATIECAKSKNLDNSVTKSEQIASSKWTRNRSVRPCLHT